LPKIIKIDLYNSELYRFKVGAFFETQCRTARRSFRSWFDVNRSTFDEDIWEEDDFYIFVPSDLDL